MLQYRYHFRPGKNIREKRLAGLNFSTTESAQARDKKMTQVSIPKRGFLRKSLEMELHVNSRGKSI